MKPTIYFTTLAAAALVGLDALPASAQTTAAAATAPASVAGGATLLPWPAKPIGRYELQIAMTDKVLPATIVIADSAGTAAAVIQTEGDPDEHAMKATVKGTELYLNTVAPKGAVEIVLQRTGDKLTGHWTYGDDKGTLEGHVEKK